MRDKIYPKKSGDVSEVLSDHPLISPTIQTGFMDDKSYGYLWNLSGVVSIRLPEFSQNGPFNKNRSSGTQLAKWKL
jgi:hypothetical protein